MGMKIKAPIVTRDPTKFYSFIFTENLKFLILQQSAANRGDIPKIRDNRRGESYFFKFSLPTHEA
jgi:hypothetical protein